MRNRRVLTTTALALSVAVAFAPLATAQQQEPTLTVPATVSPNSYVGVSAGPCEMFSTVTSPGFKEPITLVTSGGQPGSHYGNGWTTAKPGTYTATVQCDARTLTATFSVGPQEVVWSLSPTEVEPGGTIHAGGHIYDTGGCPPVMPLTSPGFAAPLEFHGGILGHIDGYTTVVTTPGTYEVVWQCATRSDRSVKTFRVLGTPPVTTPPRPGNPKPPIVKPKGAPDTGGGGTA